MNKSRRSVLIGMAAVAGMAAAPRLAAAQAYDGSPERYSPDEIINAGHRFFGTVSQGMAQSIEYLFGSRGRPNGYILGEEGGGAIIAGVRYGEGFLHTKNQGQHKLFWQGPSIGWDLGADGARTMMLVYSLHSIEDMFRVYSGVNGSAYLVAGAGASIYANNDTYVAPIRSGLGARVGVNLGYLRFTRQATWNPL